MAQGRLEGPWKWYRENGKPLQTGSFIGRKQVGSWKRFDKKGKLYDVRSFSNGKQVSAMERA